MGASNCQVVLAGRSSITLSTRLVILITYVRSESKYGFDDQEEEHHNSEEYAELKKNMSTTVYSSRTLCRGVATTMYLLLAQHRYSYRPTARSFKEGIADMSVSMEMGQPYAEK